jgi:predicted site-specific integrase-resolvase
MARRIIQLYTITEYSQNKKVNKSTVHDWINAGKITLYKTPKGRSLLNAFDDPERSN